MLCSTKASDVSHEANGEALCPEVCELLQLAMLKDFLFKVIKLLCREAALALSCLRCPAAAGLSCLRCSAATALFAASAALSCLRLLLCPVYAVLRLLLFVMQLPLFVVCAALQLLPCLVCAAQQQQLHVQQQPAWLHTRLSNGLATQLCVWTVWMQGQLSALMLVTAAAGHLYCWGCQCWQHWQRLSQSH